MLEILRRYNVKMHYLTPNAIIQFSKFLWAVKTFEGPILLDAFCRFYELHPHGHNISFEGVDQVFSAGHPLKHAEDGSLVFFFPVYVNEIMLSNPGLSVFTAKPAQGYP